MQTVIAGSITEIGAAEWNALAGDDWPFLRHEFLAAGETTGCVSPETGWRSCYLGLRDDSGRLAAALPLYEKSHSFGEFVFDWAWAQAYQRLGLDYYPKLISAIPFTPAPCRKLLIAPGQDAALAAELVTAARQFALQRNCSSLHIQFPLAGELGVLAAAGLRLRKDCQFHWHNRGYRDFDDFLRHFSSAKRKKARRDRRRVAEQGIRFRWLHGDEMDRGLWQKVYEFINLTFRLRGS
ncbi:MAG: peptidogalycan biosysnthesis protein, partial [Woeseiaceae bacterium]